AGRAGEAQPRAPGGDRGADGRVEPKRAPTGLACVPYRDDLLCFGDRLALGLATLGFLLRGSSRCSLAFLRTPPVGHPWRKGYLDSQPRAKPLSHPVDECCVCVSRGLFPF